MPTQDAEWPSRFSLAGRTALITGASKGIGAHIAYVFADAGANIVAVARDEDGLAATAKAVRSKQRDCMTVIADLATREGPAQTASQALDRVGTVDILVNSAGIALLAPASDLSMDDWDMSMAVNLRAPFILSQALAPSMIAQKAGKIINISSQTGIVAFDDHAAYAASKGGLNALTKSLCAEWARHNIQVNAICPTVVLTPMGKQIWSAAEKKDHFLAATPARRFAEPGEIADMALYLASPASAMVNGALMMIEGGYTSV